MANKKVMYIGGSWGDAIYFFDRVNKTRIYGFKDPWFNGFAEGSVLFDLANNKNNDTIPLYYISDIQYEDDPKDMFFAYIDLIGNVENPKGEYAVDWYKPYIDKVKENLIKKKNETSFFNFSERRKLKKFIRTLEEMKESK